MKPETAKALFELGRAAIKHVTGKEPDGRIEITICRDREHLWNDLAEHQLTSKETVIESPHK